VPLSVGDQLAQEGEPPPEDRITEM
jgi:hypothetical protein